MTTPVPSPSGARRKQPAHPAAPVSRLALVGALGMTLLVPAGCTRHASTSPTPTTSKASTTVKVTPLPSDPTFAGSAAGAASDIVIDACPLDPGKQTASGTVTNSGKVARDYAIIIIWMKNNDGQPYGSGLVTVKDAKPGVKTKWTVTTTVATKADYCTKNVHAGNLK